MNIRIRPHHLLCMLTFVGKGYTPAFVSNFEQIAALIATGEQTVEIVYAPDDICAAMLHEPTCHCHKDNLMDRDRLAAETLSGLLQEQVQEHTTLQLSQEMLKRLRAAFATGQIRSACRSCQWSPLCDAVAANDFIGTKLLSRDGSPVAGSSSFEQF